MDVGPESSIANKDGAGGKVIAGFVDRDRALIRVASHRGPHRHCAIGRRGLPDSAFTRPRSSKGEDIANIEGIKKLENTL